jgi:hypothetical protein
MPGEGRPMARRRSWTDEDLREAVAGARSWREVRDRLGLRGGGSTNRMLRERAASIGVSVEHLPAPGASARRFTDAELTAAVAAATSLHGVFVALRLAPGGSAWLRMQEHILRLGLDTSHWRAGTARPGQAGPRSTPAPTVPAEDVRAAMEGSRSIAEAMRRCGLDPGNGSAYRRFVRRLDELGVARGQVAGQAWAAGTTRVGRPPRPLEEILVRDSPYRGGSSKLRERLIREGVLEPACAHCGLATWRGSPAPLRLDHINGDPRDNRPENLRLLCANCDALTATYCGRNIGRRRYSGSGERGSGDSV